MGLGLWDRYAKNDARAAHVLRVDLRIRNILILTGRTPVLVESLRWIVFARCLLGATPELISVLIVLLFQQTEKLFYHSLLPPAPEREKTGCPPTTRIPTSPHRDAFVAPLASAHRKRRRRNPGIRPSCRLLLSRIALLYAAITSAVTSSTGLNVITALASSYHIEALFIGNLLDHVQHARLRAAQNFIAIAFHVGP